MSGTSDIARKTEEKSYLARQADNWFGELLEILKPGEGAASVIMERLDEVERKRVEEALDLLEGARAHLRKRCEFNPHDGDGEG